jgi:hypothetical protein
MRRLLLLSIFFLAPAVIASPYQEVRSDEALYQRVRHLSDFGLLDAGDQALLDTGSPVTRLQLAAAVRKASDKLEKSAATPVPTVVPSPVPSIASPTSVPDPSAPVARSAAGREVAALLKALRREDEYLRKRILRDTDLLAQATAGMEDLKPLRKRVEKAQGKANRNNVSPSITAYSESHFDCIALRGLADHNTGVGETKVGVNIWADLGGAGGLSTGFSGSLPLESSNSAGASIGLSSARVDLNLPGTRAGKWDLHFMDTAYDSVTSIGEFTRSGGGGMRRYEDPFNIKPYTSDKLGKVWNDYVHSIGFVEAKDTLANGGSTGEKVFDGVVLGGAGLPGLHPDARVRFLAGREGTTADRFEYAGMASHPFLRGKVSARVSCELVQDSHGVAASPDVDMRNYAGGLGLDLTPLFLSADGAFSRYDTRFDRPDLDPGVPKGHALHASASFYPLNLHWVSIHPDYSNTQSKVTLDSFRFDRYGEESINGAGFVADSDTLVSNRRGWRANLGWDGRRTGLLRDSLPRFTDFMVVNSNVSFQDEFVSAVSSGVAGMGQTVLVGGNPVTVDGNVLMEYHRRTLYLPRIVDFYYPDWSGLWGNALYAGWDFNPPNPVRQAFIDNVTAASGTSASYYSRYVSRGTAEWYALIDPVTGRDILNLKSYRYYDFTDKVQVNRLLGFKRPLFLGVYGALAQVYSRDTGAPESPDGVYLDGKRRLFERRVGDVALFVGDVLRGVHVTAHAAAEKWRSDYTAPRLDSLTRVWGAGLGWDVPWGGSKFEARYNRVMYSNAVVPANDYRGDQVLGLLKMLF